MLTFIVFSALLILSSSTSHAIEQFSCDFEGQEIADTVCSYRKFSGNDAWTIKEHEDGRGLHSLNHNQESKSISVLQSPELDLESGEYCLSLDYYIFELSSEISISSNFRPDHFMFLRNGKSSLVDKWQHFQRTIELDDALSSIYLNISAGGQIALDNLAFRRGRCPESGELVCDFDWPQSTSLEPRTGCDWMQIVGLNITNQLQFQIKRSEPLMDQTTMDKRGFTLLVRKPRSDNSDPYIGGISFGEFYPEGGRRCLSFYYRGIETMSWSIVETSLDGTIENVLAESSDAEPLDTRVYWNYAQADIDPVVPIAIKMKIEGNHFLDLDSFKLLNGKCPKPVNCEFNDNLCGWGHINPKANELGRTVFRIGSGVRETMVPYVRISSYLYLNPKVVNSNAGIKWVTMYSEWIAEGSYCLQFDIASISFIRATPIRVVIELRTLGTSKRAIGIDVDSDQWTRQVIDLKTMGDKFKIFIGMIGLVVLGDLKIKDLVLDQGSCGEVTRTSNKSSLFPQVDFHCYQTGHYIPQHRVCDGVIDCPMGEDEGDHCELNKCELEGIPCKRRRFHFCLKDTSSYCDGVRDCDDGIDEDPRLCNSQMFCNNYCLNDGQCWETNLNAFKCNCRQNFAGKRCQFLSEPLASNK